MSQSGRSAAPARRRSDWHAVFAGDGDGLAGLRRSRPSWARGARRIRRLGGRWRDQGLLSTADVCLSPEPPTPLNLVSTMIKVAEYMAMERPVVAFDLPETRYTAAEAAVYAPANDEAAYAGHIGELLDDPQRRAAMGRPAAPGFVSGMSWPYSEQALLAAYDAAPRGCRQAEPMSIAIVVLTNNRVELLRQCVENVLARTSPKTREIVVWDNASTDGTRTILDSLIDPRLRVVHHPSNIGQNAYARAFATTSAEYMIELDDDVVDAPPGLGT